MKGEKNPLRTASELAREGNVGEAIACLEEALARSRSSASRPANTPLLAKTAGLLCEHHGDLLRAASYYEEAIATEGPEAANLVALADVYSGLGRLNEAEACLGRAEAAAQSTGSDDDLQLVAAARAMLGGTGGPAAK
jgi:tetratricopeptide (TPR) repeat protein